MNEQALPAYQPNGDEVTQALGGQIQALVVAHASLQSQYRQALARVAELEQAAAGHEPKKKA